MEFAELDDAVDRLPDQAEDSSDAGRRAKGFHYPKSMKGEIFCMRDMYRQIEFNKEENCDRVEGEFVEPRQPWWL